MDVSNYLPKVSIIWINQIEIISKKPKTYGHHDKDIPDFQT